MQWHPLFAKLLRPLLEGYFDIQVNVAVGDVPREADLVLVRRTGAGRAPFQGLWKHLTAWNVLEYKGPSVFARSGDVERLVELGLGIHRRLHEKGDLPPATDADEVSFWYLAHRLGARFLSRMEAMLDHVERLGPGIWCGRVLRHPLFLVSGRDLPVEADSLPLHILQPEAAGTEGAVTRLLSSHPDLLPGIREWIINLRPALFKELATMASSKHLTLQLKPLIDIFGMEEVLRQLSQELDTDEKTWLKFVLRSLTPKRRKVLKKCLQEQAKDE